MFAIVLLLIFSSVAISGPKSIIDGFKKIFTGGAGTSKNTEPALTQITKDGKISSFTGAAETSENLGSHHTLPGLIGLHPAPSGATTSKLGDKGINPPLNPFEESHFLNSFQQEKRLSINPSRVSTGSKVMHDEYNLGDSEISAVSKGSTSKFKSLSKFFKKPLTRKEEIVYDVVFFGLGVGAAVTTILLTINLRSIKAQYKVRV